jgi:hypothetical protein
MDIPIMKIKAFLLSLLTAPLLASSISAKEPKEYDYDVNYDEARLPA